MSLVFLSNCSYKKSVLYKYILFFGVAQCFSLYWFSFLPHNLSILVVHFDFGVIRVYAKIYCYRNLC